MLTDKQQNILSYIQSHYKEKGIHPSVREMGKNFQLTATAIQQHINALKKKGMLFDKQVDTAAYSLSPESITSLLRTKEQSYIQPTDDSSSEYTNLLDFPDNTIDILGSIAAGHPFSSETDEKQTLDLSPEFFDASKCVFGLYVSGDSMIGDYICDGDVAIIKKQSNYKSHDIVAVRVDNDEFTLKRVEKDDNWVSLIPSNTNFSIKRLKAHRIEIVGRYLGLVRKG